MVRQLIKVHLQLKKMKYNMHIVPVSINYERIFDVRYLAEDTIQGHFKPQTTFFNLADKIYKMRSGKLGKVFVKYSEAIDLNEYVKAFKNSTKPDVCRRGHQDIEKISRSLDYDSLSM